MEIRLERENPSISGARRDLRDRGLYRYRTSGLVAVNFTRITCFE